MTEITSDPQRLAPRLTATDLGKDLMISDESAGRVSVLNKTARIVWELHHAGASNEEVASRLTQSYPGLAADTALADVVEIIQTFRDSGLLGSRVVADAPTGA